MTRETLPVLAGADEQTDIMERVIVQGDLAKLTPEERVRYYLEICRSLSLNAMTQPFQYITLNGKLTLYARKDATDQLRKLHGVSVDIIAREKIDDLYVVTARATTPDGRHDEEIGAVCIAGLKGESLANALMKCTSKSKRRVTLSLVGLGLLDESEVDAIPTARTVRVDMTTGEVLPPEASQTAPGRPSRPALPPAAPTATPAQNSAQTQEEEKRARFIEALSGFLCDADLLGLTPDALGVTEATPLGRLVLAAQAQNRDYHEMPLGGLTTEEIRAAGKELRPMVLAAKEEGTASAKPDAEAPREEG